MHLATINSMNKYDIRILNKYNNINTPWYEDVHYGNIVFMIANNRINKLLKYLKYVLTVLHPE